MVLLTEEQMEKKKAIENEVHKYRDIVYLYNLKIKQQELKMKELVNNNAILQEDMNDLENTIQEMNQYILSKWGSLSDAPTTSS